MDVKVLDFGLAKPVIPDAQATALTQTGSLMGTPLYMSPEQVDRAGRSRGLVRGPCNDTWGRTSSHVRHDRKRVHHAGTEAIRLGGPTKTVRAAAQAGGCARPAPTRIGERRQT